MANGRPTPYQAFGTLYDRIKNVTDDHGRQPYVAPMRSRRDTTLSLKILNLLRAVGKPSAHEIDKAKRAALKTVHPDLLMGSPELISDPAGLEICLEEATQVRGYLDEKATLALTRPRQTPRGSRPRTVWSTRCRRGGHLWNARAPQREGAAGSRRRRRQPQHRKGRPPERLPLAAQRRAPPGHHGHTRIMKQLVKRRTTRPRA
jgi:hypothetical protein